MSARTSPRSGAGLLILVLVFSLCAAVLGAQTASLPSALPRVRADDGGLWHVEDNPANLGFGTSAQMGFMLSQMDSSGRGLAAGQEFSEPAHVAVSLPVGIYYRAGLTGTAWELCIGTALSAGSAFSLGYATTWSSTADGWSRWTMGVTARPANFLSLAATADLVGSQAPRAGFGIALRPLALAGGSGRALTLTGDFLYDAANGPQVETLGAHLELGGSLGLSAFWNPLVPSTGRLESFGLALSLRMGALAVEGSAPRLNAVSPGYTVGETMTIPDAKGRELSLLPPGQGRRILLIKDLDAISPLGTGGDRGAAFSGTTTASFRDLLAEIEVAQRDPGVVAVAFENLPSLQGLAYWQELADALSRLRKAGKQVWFHADAYDGAWPVIASCADRIALNPNGAVAVQGLGFHRAYMKPLLDAIGVSVVNLAPWDTKSAYNNYTMDSMPEGEKAMMSRLLGDIQEQYAAGIKAGRGGRIKGAGAIEGGPALVAAEALSRGLVDSIAYREEFEEDLGKAFPGARFVGSLPRADEGSWGQPAFARRVAVVYLQGQIGLGKGSAGKDIGSLAALELEKLRKDASVAGIILRVDSPGGAVLTSDNIAREVRLAVASGKPVAVSMGWYAASGGYYVSAPASWIVAEPGTITGSIGVTGLLPNLSGTLGKLGVRYDGFDLGPGASFADPFKPSDPEEAARLDAMILATYDRFLGVVAEGRHMELGKVRTLAEGQVWTGRQALERGLVDELGGLDTAKAWMAGRLGGRTAFFEVTPGEEAWFLSGFGGLGAGLRLCADVLGGAAKKASVAGIDADAVTKALGPLAARLGELSELGSGPLYLLDVGALPLP